VAADETTPAVRPPYPEGELEQSRQTAARLMESLARKIGSPGVRQTAGSISRAAHYVQAYSVKDMAKGIERSVRRRPAASVLAAIVTGYLVGRVLRSR
jgi:hypothetical protein